MAKPAKKPEPAAEQVFDVAISSLRAHEKVGKRHQVKDLRPQRVLLPA